MKITLLEVNITLRHRVLQQQCLKSTTETLYLPHPGFHSQGADHPSTSCRSQPLWASPLPCSAWPSCQTEERGKHYNFSPIPIFARPSPLRIFQLNIYDNLPVKLDLL